MTPTWSPRVALRTIRIKATTNLYGRNLSLLVCVNQSASYAFNYVTRHYSVLEEIQKGQSRGWGVRSNLLTSPSTEAP